MARRIVARIAIGLLVLVAVLVAGVVALDTAPGHRLVTRLAGGFKLENGLRFAIGRIDGSIYGRMTLRDVVVRDATGVVATIPALAIDWSPGALLQNRVEAARVEAGRATVLRRPVLLPTPPSPLLPDIDILIGRLVVRQLVLDAPVTGTSQVIALEASTDIADGRAKLSADARADRGDRLVLRLDAVPAADRFLIDARLDAPAGGAVDGLAKLGKPLALDIDGSGTWAAWRGRAAGTLGGAPLLDLALTANAGRFTAKGSARPGLVLPGTVARLTAPALAIDATAVAADRKLDTNLRLTSTAIDLAARGQVDLAAGRYGGLRIEAQLLQPGAVLDDVRGRDVRAVLVLDGPFATPTVDYVVTAAALGFGATGVERLRAAGLAVVDAEAIRLPVALTAARVTGVDAAVGGLLRNVRLDGDIRITAQQVVSDNLRLRSDKIDATLIAAATLATGEYTAAFKGQVNRYALPGVGIVDLVTDARLSPAGQGQFAVRGNVRATTVRIDNPSAREFLGGNALVTAAIDRSPDGLIAVGSLRVTAPRFRVTEGRGSYRSDGRIAFAARGNSAQYGPLAIDVSGTVARPVARLRAARPNVGVQLTGVEAMLRPAPGGYAVTARGGSPYGPFAVDVGLRVGTGPLAVDVRRASLAGLVVSGQVAATAAGPYTGALALTGPGLAGSVKLAAAGKVQRADVALRANNARIPLPDPVLIGQGTLAATAILYPNAPSITGNAVFAGVRQGTLEVANLKASGAYRGGSGRLDLTADGASGVPFTIATNIGFAPEVIRVAGQASVSRVPLRLAAPAELRAVKGGWSLAPVTVLLPDGRVAVSGSTGTATRLDATLQAVDLAIVEALRPGLGLTGKASGTVAFALPARGGFPTGRADLRIGGFSRAGLTTISAPVDIAVLGSLAATGADASAVLRRGGTVLGRLKATLAPVPGTAAQPWSERLLAASLGGGIRYNGPAELLWALSGVSGQELAGPIAVGADFGGRLSAPQVRGLVRGKGLRYANAQYGTVIDRLDLDSRFVDTRLEIVRLTGRAGDDGQVSATGYADLAADKGFPVDIRVKLARAQLARSNAIQGTLSGDIAITNSANAGALIAGDLNINRARYVVLRPAAAEVVELTGVRRRNAPPPVPAPPGGGPSVFRLAINIRAANEIFVSGMGLEAEWRTDLKIGGTATEPRIVGTVNLVRGTYGFGGRSFALSRGVIRFAGEVPFNPLLDIEATTTVDGLTAIINIGGRAFAPEIAFTSTPALAQDEVLSRLLFGSSVTALTPTQALQLAASLNTLRGSSGGGFNPLGTLRSATGIDRLRILGADKTTGAGPSLAAGKYISNKIYVEVTTDARGFTATQLEIALSKTLRILSSVSSFGGSNVALRYSKDY